MDGARGSTWRQEESPIVDWITPKLRNVGNKLNETVLR